MTAVFLLIEKIHLCVTRRIATDCQLQTFPKEEFGTAHCRNKKAVIANRYDCLYSIY